MPKGYKGFQRGDLNHMWKDNNVGYVAIHGWVKRYLPRPKLCGDCNSCPPRDLANKSNNYLRDLSDWEWLCRKCHMTKDGRMEKLIDRNINNPPQHKELSEETMILLREIAKRRKRGKRGRFI